MGWDFEYLKDDLVKQLREKLKLKTKAKMELDPETSSKLGYGYGYPSLGLFKGVAVINNQNIDFEFIIARNPLDDPAYRIKCIRPSIRFEEKREDNYPKPITVIVKDLDDEAAFFENLYKHGIDYQAVQEPDTYELDFENWCL